MPHQADGKTTLAAGATRGLDQRHAVVLVTAGLVVLASAFNVSTRLDRQAHASHLINVLGHERTLTERVARQALALAATTDPRAIRETTAALDQSLGELQSIRNHALPGAGVGDLEMPISPTGADSTAYRFLVTNPAVTGLITDGLALVRFARTSPTARAPSAAWPASVEPYVARILANEPAAMDVMERLVTVYDARSTVSVEGIRVIVVVGAIIMVIGLLLQKWLVLRPASQQLNRVFDALNTTQRDLHRERTRFEQVASLAPVGIFHADDRLGLTFVNQEVCTILGVTESTLLGGTWIPYIHQDDRHHVLTGMRVAQEQDRNFEVVNRIVRPDGTIRTVRSRCDIQRDEHGRITAYIGMMADVTEQVAAEMAVHESEAILHEAQALARLGHFRIDLVSNTVVWSPEIYRIFGCDPALDPPPMEEVRERYHPDDARVLFRLLEQAMTDGSPWRADVRVLQPDGTVTHVETRGRALRNARGEIVSLLGTAFDITERKRTEAALQQYADDLDQARLGAERLATEFARVADDLEDARAVAEESVRLKSEFLANMSHEIRTPMNAIIGFSDLLLGMELGEKQRGFVETIAGAGHHLLSTINDILDFTKLDAGHMQLEQAPFDLRDLVEEVAQLLAPRAHRQGLLLLTNYAAGLPRIVVGDQARMRQVLTNLAGNAVKFTARGHVEVEVKGTASAPGTVRLTIAVCDTGPGIAPEQQQRIFEKFTQADGAVSRRFGGTGLGLAICREITRLMGGTIGVDSAPGYGSRFWVVVEMPVGPGECLGEPSTEVVLALAATTPPVPAPLHAVAHGAGQGLRVLVAEDHAVNRELAATMLQKLGCVVYLASDGSDALTVHESLPVDLIFMDCHMPVMDGFAATAAIRAREAGTGRHVPIVALTASAMHEDRLRCTEAGMDEFLSKPVQLADFATILEAVAARKDAVTLEWHSVAQSA